MRSQYMEWFRDLDRHLVAYRQADQLVERVGSLLEVGSEQLLGSLCWCAQIRVGLALERCVFGDDLDGIVVAEAGNAVTLEDVASSAHALWEGEGGGCQGGNGCDGELHFGCCEGCLFCWLG